MPVLNYDLKKKPTAIIFDWDNTLVDTWPIIADSLNATLFAFNQTEWTLNEVKKRVKYSLRDSFPDLFGTDWEDAAIIFYEHYKKFHLKLIKPVIGAPALLQEIYDLGIFVSVVSNKKGSYLREESKHLNWDKYFNKLVGANDAVSDKPSKEPVELALADLHKQSRCNIWFIGDSDIDIECAINSGCVPILIRKRKPSRHEFKTCQSLHYFKNIEELCKNLKNLYR